MNINYDLLKKSKLKQDFYLQTPDIIAKKLLGKILVKKNNDDFLAGIIVETEAYLCEKDLASHSAKGKTNANSAMFMNGGTLYVYKIYGIHHCINVVSEKENIGSAVLLRAIEPIYGIELMAKYRKNNDLYRLCKGPGNLAQAFYFNFNDNKKSFLEDELFISEYNIYNDFEYEKSKRIGISKSQDLLLRFFIKDSKFLSGKK